MKELKKKKKKNYKIVSEGFDKDFGARLLSALFKIKIEDIIAQGMLKDEIKRGDKISVSVDASSQIILNKI